jgi:RimJ/RimL family protein N-acetyltransferase
MGLALRKFATHGVNALISTVEWTNDASMKSCARLGYRRLGLLAQARIAGCPWWRTSPRVREHGVEIITPTSSRKLTFV